MLIPYNHANAAHVHVCLPQIAGASVIGSRGSGKTLIGLAADECCSLYLICTLRQVLLACILPWLFWYCQQRGCMLFEQLTRQLAHRRPPPGATRECFRRIFRVAIARFSVTPSAITRFLPPHSPVHGRRGSIRPSSTAHRRQRILPPKAQLPTLLSRYCSPAYCTVTTLRLGASCDLQISTCQIPWSFPGNTPATLNVIRLLIPYRRSPRTTHHKPR